MLEGSEQQFSLIIKKTKKELPRSLKIDVKHKKEVPKRVEIYLISDEYDKDRLKSIIFEGKVPGKMTNDKFKETLYSKLFVYFRSVGVPIAEIDLGASRANGRQAEGQSQAPVRGEQLECGLLQSEQLRGAEQACSQVGLQLQSLRDLCARVQVDHQAGRP